MSFEKISQTVRESRVYPILRKFSRGIEKGIKRIININRFEHGKSEMRKNKGIYHGQRCFIIGNGPSLTIADLDRINGEFSIASNSI